jgi:hypothetical protein
VRMFVEGFMTKTSVISKRLASSVTSVARVSIEFCERRGVV